MGGCRRGYRGLLAELGQAQAAEKRQAFQNLATGTPSSINELLQQLQQYPGLINQQSDESHKSTILISALYELQHTSHAEKKNSSAFFREYNS